jgi:hypothetical protein
MRGSEGSGNVGRVLMRAVVSRRWTRVLVGTVLAVALTAILAPRTPQPKRSRSEAPAVNTYSGKTSQLSEADPDALAAPVKSVE